jgi:prophage antirepressor-like protein
MSAEIVPFAFDGADVRAVVIDDQPWFIAADVAKILGYRDATNAVRTLRDRHRGTHPVSTPGGVQNLVVVSESGIYRLAMRSDMPAAEDFQDWIAEEVLPAIRKTGRYDAGPRSELTDVREKIEILALATDHGLAAKADARRETRRLLASIGIGDQPPTPADELLRWTRRLASDATFSTREAHRSLHGRDWARNSADVQDVLDGLVSTGHRHRLAAPTAARIGRPPSPRYQVARSAPTSIGGSL